MKQAFTYFEKSLEQFRENGTYKNERIITTPQNSRINTSQVDNVINMCANNYLGFSNHKDIIEAAKKSYDDWGYGLSSVRFICG
ncbi:MAG: glycine C-acetyltransferase, partial [Oscillospiraceae bacterium]